MIIPGTRFNGNRDKLFFYYNQEYYRQLLPNGAKTFRVPTALERSGNFSATTDGNGNRTVIRDPAGTGPFAGNIIPAPRFFSDGTRILNVYPIPNDPRGGNRYNYSTQISSRQPRREDIVSVDYHLSDKTRASARYVHNADTTFQPYGGGSNIAYDAPLTTMQQNQYPFNATLNVTHIFNPSTVNVFIFAAGRSKAVMRANDDGLQRAHYGITFPMLFSSVLGTETLPSLPIRRDREPVLPESVSRVPAARTAESQLQYPR